MTIKQLSIMEIIKELIKQDSAISVGGSFRLLDKVEAGDYKLSLQASEGHYCSPRKTLSIYNYAEMEMAIFKNDAWVFPNADENIKSFLRYEELIERADCLEGATCVFGYVPVDLINDLYTYLKSL